MNTDDRVLSHSCGMYKSPLPLSIEKPYYARRMHFLKSIRKWKCQLLVNFLGQLQWINIDDSYTVTEWQSTPER